MNHASPAAATGPLFPILDGRYQMEREPVVRIGLVLAEDGRGRLGMRADSARGLRAESAPSGAAAPIPSGTTLEAQVLPGDRVAVMDAARGLRYAEGTTVRLIPLAGGDAPSAGCGTLVEQVVAGRGFHWHKLIDATYTGTLELQARGGKLLLINELPLEEYLTGVITGEMSGECPIEYMKAQAIAARSWLLGQPRSPHPGQPFHWCNDDCCQRYQGTGGWTPRAVEAIAQCRGEVLITPSNKYCDARYSKSTGSISEDATSVWGEEIEGLVSVVDAPPGSYAEKFFPITEGNIEEYLLGDWLKDADSFASPKSVPENAISKYLGRVDEHGEYFRWTIELGHEEMVKALKARGHMSDVSEVLELIPVNRGRSGRLEALDVRYRDASGVEKTGRLAREYGIRAGLSTKFLFSSCFLVEHRRDSGGHLTGVTLRGGGWGHGAGMCQIGGLGRALAGQQYNQILLHYFTGVRLERIYP